MKEQVTQRRQFNSPTLNTGSCTQQDANELRKMLDEYKFPLKQEEQTAPLYGAQYTQNELFYAFDMVHH